MGSERELCEICGCPVATEEDWKNCKGGERPDLCWEPGAALCRDTKTNRPTYDPTRERVVPLDASPSDVVVLSREDAALLHYVAKSWWALFGNSPRKIGKNTAWRALQAIRSALGGEHAE